MIKIGSVAATTGLSPDAIRFYERSSLLPHPPRTPAGYRLYSPSDLETLTFIRRMQALGFTLAEVRHFLRLRASSHQPCAPVRRRLTRKLCDVRARLSDLRRLERELLAALQSCRRIRRRRSSCPLLRASASRGPSAAR